MFDRQEMEFPKAFMDVHLRNRSYFCLVVGHQHAYMFDQDTSMDDPLALMPVTGPIRMGGPEAGRVVRFEDDEALMEMGGDRFGVHLTDVKLFSTAFGRGFKSADIDFSKYPSAFFCHPGGGLIHWEAAAVHKKWISMLGYSWEELEDPAVRFAFNLSSARWAAEQFENVDAMEEDTGHALTERSLIQHNRSTEPQPGDKYYCGSCSYSQKCPAYREGSVCTLTADGKKLIEQFRSRNAWTIIEGMTDLVADNVNRYQVGRDKEEETGKLDPAVTSINAQLFRQTNTLLKLHAPEFRNPMLQINAMGGVNVGVTPQQQTPQQLTAKAQQALVSAGCPADDIELVHITTLIDKGITEHAIRDVAAMINNPVIEAGEVNAGE